MSRGAIGDLEPEEYFGVFMVIVSTQLHACNKWYRTVLTRLPNLSFLVLSQKNYVH